MSAREAFVTLVTTDPYCMGAVAVARSLRHHGTTRSLVVLVTPNVSEQSRITLNNTFDDVVVVDLMDSRDDVHLSMLGRPELGITFTKIHCWTLTQYRKCVFLDADTLVLSNVDELFEREELSAAPDPGWPDCFNSGVFVFRPSVRTHRRLLEHAKCHGSFDGGDQGLLNSFFSSWPVADIGKHLPFVYNLTSSAAYTYLPAFQQFGHNAKIVHFTGAVKPWSAGKSREDSQSHLMEQFVSLWWKEYLSYPTSAPPEKQLHPRSPSPQKSREQEDKMPFTESFDDSTSLLAHFSRPPDSLHVSSEVDTGNGTGDSPLKEEELRTDETADTRDPDVEEEEEEEEQRPDCNGADTEKRHEAADDEAEQLERRRRWEDGRMEYLGRDAFQNIQRMLDSFLK